MTVGFTALAALSGCFARWFSSRVSALKGESRIHFDTESANTSTETVSSLEWSADWTGKAAVGFTAAAALSGSLSWFFSWNVSAMNEDARSRFELESKTKMKTAEEGTAKALAEAATAKENTSKLEVEAARLREQAMAAEAKIKAAEARAAEANEQSAKAGEGTAKALAEAAVAKENIGKLAMEAARLR
ncbi:MAG TPA: hypothetical protein VN039_11680, partial [Nitrospira sp.]|nr:hypothetical protein [Nitrospira sp.]